MATETNQVDQNVQYIDVPSSSYMPQSFGMGMPLSQDRASLIKEIKSETIVEIIRHKLLGEELINGEWRKVKELQRNALSEQGAWEIANLMLGAGSINMQMSKLDSNQINNRLRALIKEAMTLMIANWKSYGIRNTGQFYYVKSLLMSNGIAVINQALGGHTSITVMGTINEQRNIMSEVKKPGLLSGFLGGRK